MGEGEAAKLVSALERRFNRKVRDALVFYVFMSVATSVVVLPAAMLLAPWIGALFYGSVDLAVPLQLYLVQGFWAVMQLYLEIDRGISAANLDTRAQLVTKDSVGDVGKRFEN